MTRKAGEMAENPMPKAIFAGLCRILALWSVLAGPAAAIPDPAALCDQAAQRAARLEGVPLDILLAITRAETGRSDGQVVRPWPWTINVAGQGSWFETPQEAMDKAQTALDAGLGNFDVGCFQLNYRWHGAAFASVEAMFDPEDNAVYAARFLAQLYAKSGSWAQAVADYHSKTDALAEIYLARVEALLGGGLTAGDGQDPVQTPPPEVLALRENLFPLLQPGEAGAMGSLVPQTRSRGALFAAKS